MDNPNTLYVLRFAQTDVLQKPLSHWALMLLETGRATVFHLTRSDSDDTPRYECCSGSLERWMNSPNLVDTHFLGATHLSLGDIDAVCRKIAAEHQFSLVRSNCQDYIVKCTRSLGYSVDLYTLRQLCTCIVVSDLTSPRGRRRCSMT